MAVKIGSVAEIEAEGRKFVLIDGVDIGVFIIDGRPVAWRNECPHQGGPVCQGRLFKRVIEPMDEEKRLTGRQEHPTDVNLVCPWHGMEFDLRTGQFFGNHAMALEAVKVAVIDDAVYVG